MSRIPMVIEEQGRLRARWVEDLQRGKLSAYEYYRTREKKA